MTGAEPTSTNSTSDSAENADCQPSSVAISEENLAALLRATTSTAEPEAQRPAEDAEEIIPVSDVDGTRPSAPPMPPASCPDPAVGPPAVEASRLALIATLKEHRSAILSSGVTPVAPPPDLPPAGKVDTIPVRTAEQDENFSASSVPEVAPLQATLPQARPLIPAPAESVATPSWIAIGRDQSHVTSRNRLMIGLIIGAVIVVVGVSAFLTRAHSSKAPRVAASAPKDNFPLQLQVEPLGNGLINIRWNPQSASIAQARDGRLVITERDQQPRILALEADQLKIGHLTYQSSVERVEFYLEVVDRSGAIAKESVLALLSPMSSGQKTETPPQTPREQSATVKPQNIPNSEATAEAPQPSQPKVRAFAPPAVQRTTEQRAILDAPPTFPSWPVIPPVVSLPASLPAISLPPTGNGAAPQQVRIESTLQAANLIKRVTPTYPLLAKSAGIQGTVRFTALIGKDGRIQNLKLITGPGVLVDSASGAVKQWVYRPTLLNGEPVEVLTQIDVNFTLSR